LNLPVSSLLVGDRLISRCEDGLLEAEYALFDRSEVLLSSGVREEGYMTTAGLARARLYEGLVTADLAYEAFAAMRGRQIRPLARSSAVREVIDHLGPYETFQGGRFVAGRGRYAGVWLDLDALAAECPLRDASILFQALHLVLVLGDVMEDAPVRLLTSPAGTEGATGGRTWRRVDLEQAQRLPWILREMQATTRSHGAPHDEAEVREEILRDLHARAAATAMAQPRLITLAAAIARTGSTPPPGMPGSSISPTKRMSSSPPWQADGSSSRPAPPRPTPRPPPDATQPRDQVGPVVQSVTAKLERQPFAPDLAILAPRPIIESQTALVVRPARNTPPSDDLPLDDARGDARGDRRVLDPRLVLLLEPDSQRSASFRLLRDNLLARKAPRIIAVSSGSVHEGKTTCAINLALALSEKPSTRVLLMEGNFFAPSLGDIFRMDATTRPDPEMNLPLLSPYRIARMMRGFHVAALVKEAGEPPPVFNSRWFDMVIDHLSGAQYDHLVIDAAALDGSPAVTQMLGVADGTLLTVRSHATTARSLRRAAEQIPEGRALGVTLMDIDP
jgi:Mrp family chromosome partitioning ATPase